MTRVIVSIRCALKLAGALAIVVFLIRPNVSHAEAWRFGSFQITWPDGYVHLPRAGIVQFVNSKGIGVTVDVISPAPIKIDQERQAVQNWRSYARIQLAGVAARHGSIVIPVREDMLSTGPILVSFADQQQSGDAVRFGLFFLIISQDGSAAQIVVEGPGSAVERMHQFRPVIDTARWSFAVPPPASGP